MNPIQRLRNWTMRLPNIWGLGQAEIHSSLIILLAILSLLIAVLGVSRPGFAELLPAAVTLPVVWVLSLAVRVAAQQLMLGENSQDMETTVGPTGNLATDYEYLPAKQILFYSLAGQLATCGLALLGFVVNAAISQNLTSQLTLAQVFDLKGGWGSQAVASQIMWINLFLCVLHLLPTVPFDMRATIFAVFSLRNRNAQEPLVFRKLAGLVSHLSTFMLGIGLTTLVFSWVLGREIVGWYAAIAAAVYLFVAGQWESSRAEELEEQYAPVPTLKFRHHAGYTQHTHLHFQERSAAEEHSDEVAGLAAGDVASPLADLEEPSLALDVDEILRKLHREGPESLSTQEQQALLSASRKLKERRAKPTS